MNDTTRLLLQLLNQDSLDFATCCLSSFGSGYLKFCLDFICPLCLRKTDSAKQANDDLRPGILRAVAAVLLILGGGLYLWKIHGKKMETGRGRLPFSFHAHIPLFLHWILDILSPTICSLEMSLQRC